MKLKIETFDELYELVETDSNSHKLKEIAKLFLNGMNDWPTYNQTSIFEFITELKEFYGFPLTLEIIDNKKIDFNIENNAWRNEAGSSIAEMIELSKIYYDEPNFERIIENILNYYSSL